MPELPLPSFATLEKLYGWASEQATAFGSVLASPANYYRDAIIHLPDPLSQSIKFLAFVILVLSVAVMPIDAVIWRVDVFDVKNLVSGTVLMLLAILLFSFNIFWAGRLLRGRGDLPHVLAAMFYSSALIIVVILTKFVTRLDPMYRQMMITGDLSPEHFLFSPIGILGSILELTALIWIVVKLVPLIKIVHEVGRLRALLIIAVAGVIDQLYEWFVWMPFFAEMVKGATKA